MRKLVLICRVLLIAMLTTLPAHLRAQSKEIDSLLHQLRCAKEDTNKVLIYKELSYRYFAVNPDTGIMYGREGLALAEKLDWKLGICWTNVNIGINYENKAAYPTALEFFLKALKIAEESNDVNSTTKIMINIGIVYDDQRNYSKALKYYTESLDYLKARNEKGNVALVMGNIALVYRAMGDHNRALQYDTSALTVYRQLKDDEGIVRLIGNIGIVYEDIKDFPKALEYEFEALDMYKKRSDQHGIALATGIIGSVYVEWACDTTHTRKLATAVQRDYLLKGITYLQKSIALSMQLGYLEYAFQHTAFLARANEQLGNYKEALAQYQRYYAMKDSIFSLENAQKVNNLVHEHEIEIKDRDIKIAQLAVAKAKIVRIFYTIFIVLLIAVIITGLRSLYAQRRLNSALFNEKQVVERQSDELQHTNDELKETLQNLKQTQAQLILTEKQKENEMIRSRISQDIHDDISSELTRISWVSEIAKAKAKKGNNREVETLLDKVIATSRETVTKLGEIIWTVNPKNDTVCSLLVYMRSHISKFLTDTRFNYSIQFPEQNTEVTINPELKRNLFLVMKEALNNAVKYSQAQHIHVIFELDNQRYRLTIADDGKGIEKEKVQGGGNGLTNMSRRMNAVQGNCEIVSAPGRGTSIVASGTIY